MWSGRGSAAVTDHHVTGEGSYAAEEVLVEIERRNSERDRRERLFWQYEAALVAIAQGHEKPVELAIKMLMGG